MVIRQAYDADQKAIVALLKITMPNSAIPKSEALWNWKHAQNPFGTSYVLVAEENGQLVGMRAFMKWQWQRNDIIFQAVRAVDTVTHPDFQGKGIFKALTLKQLDICQRDGIRFVFNTPNAKSLPGYLKMGWKQLGKMPLKFKIVKPLSIVNAKLFGNKNEVIREKGQAPYQKWTQNIFDLLNGYSQYAQQLTTIVSPEYISWRYAHNPLFTYYYFTDNKNFLLIGRIKIHDFARELRLVDFFKFGSKIDKGYLNKYIKNEILTFCNNNNIGFISLSGQQYKANKVFFKWMGNLPIMKVGPIVTLRDINITANFYRLLQVKNWCYSIGDLEVF